MIIRDIVRTYRTSLGFGDDWIIKVSGAGGYRGGGSLAPVELGLGARLSVFSSKPNGLIGCGRRQKLAEHNQMIARSDNVTSTTPGPLGDMFSPV